MDFLNEQEKLGTWAKFKRFCTECRRVLSVTKKPSNQEFKTIVKVSGIGLAVIGLVGFLVAMVKAVFF